MRDLSQEEIDKVFHRRQPQAAAPEKRAVPFDFEKPDRIPKSQLRAIRFLYENFARTLSSSLSGYLRAFTSGHLVSVEQISYATFLDGLPPHTCMVSLSLMPYGDNGILEINPTLIFPILELLLGGKDTTTPVNRDLTEMERHLLTNFYRIIARDLEQAWKEVDQIEVRVDPLETKLRSSRGLSPTEAVVAIGMEFRIDDSVGMINLVIPSITVKSLVQKFYQQLSHCDTQPEDGARRQILKLVSRASVTVEPRMTSRLSVGDLLGLKKGSIVVLDHAISEPLVSAVNGKAKFSGEIVSDGDQLRYLIDSVKRAETD